MSVARYHPVELPVGICLRCFNAQQQLRFPFVVYCAHRETLAIIRAADQHVTFACTEAQLPAVLRKLQQTSRSVDHAPTSQ